VASYYEAFQLFDEDGSGELDTEELGNVIRSIGFQVSEAEVVDMVEESDEDRSGALDFIEFIEVCLRKRDEKERNTLDHIQKQICLSLFFFSSISCLPTLPNVYAFFLCAMYVCLSS
jgi:Ca2+-binding EF-hand superfamily protein